MPRTNIVIDAALMEQARAAAGTRTMRETVERALHALIREQKGKTAASALRELRADLSLDGLDWREARNSGRR